MNDAISERALLENISPHHQKRQNKEPFPPVRVAGMVPLTATDYPGKLSAVLFLQGCPWRCGYCHNPHLLARDQEGQISWEAVMSFLSKRRGLLDAVVFSGGEPTQQEELINAVKEVREQGYSVGLHTGGAYPERLAELLPFLDWVGMDYKICFDLYSKITRVPRSGEKARESARLLVSSGVSYEFRTTLHPQVHTDEIILRGAHELVELGATAYFIQEFRSKICADQALQNLTGATSGFRVRESKCLMDQLERLFPRFGVRYA